MPSIIPALPSKPSAVTNTGLTFVTSASTPIAAGTTLYSTAIQQVFTSSGFGAQLINAGTVWQDAPTSFPGVQMTVALPVNNSGTMVMLADNGTSYDYFAQQNLTVFANSGTLTNSGNVFVIANNGTAEILWSDYAQTHTNSGLLAAQSLFGTARGFFLHNGGTIDNKAGGRILVEAPNAIAIRSNVATTIINAGLIEAKSLDPNVGSVAIRIGSTSGGPAVIDNSGTIRGDYAIETNPLYRQTTPDAEANDTVINRAGGLISGMIALTYGNDTVTNAGTISGAVVLGEGNDLFDNTAGQLIGFADMGWNDDKFLGGAGADQVGGDSGNDELYGNGGDDLLLGGGNDDLLVGGAGSDGLYGEYGNDRIVTQGGDHVDGGEGDDRIELGDYTFELARGAAGFDTLLLAQAPRLLDLASAIASGRVIGFERIELGGSGGIVVRAGDAQTLTEGGTTLQIAGAATDHVYLVGSWISDGPVTVGGKSFAKYHLGNEIVLVGGGALVDVQASAPGSAQGLAAQASSPAPKPGDPGNLELTPFELELINYDMIQNLHVNPEEVWWNGYGQGVISAQTPGLTLVNDGEISSLAYGGPLFFAQTIPAYNLQLLDNRGEIYAYVEGESTYPPEQEEQAGFVNAYNGGNDVINSGIINAFSPHGVVISVSNPKGKLINTGEISAFTKYGLATGVFDPAYMENRGDILAYGGYSAIGVEFHGAGIRYDNTGQRTSTNWAQIVAKAYPGRAEVGVKFQTQFEAAFINEGTVTAAVAFLLDRGPYSGNAAFTLTNRGLLDGTVELGNAGDTVINAGRISGRISLNGGNDSYQGKAATTTQVVDGGAGNDTIATGSAADAITGGAGDDTIDGGANVDTAVVAGNRAAYSVTQTSTGVFQVVGPDGTDTLTNVEFLKFDDQIVRLVPGNPTAVNFANDNPSTYMAAIRDFDGNDLGSAAGWKLIGSADVNGDGDMDSVFVNKDIGRFAEVGTAPDGKVYFSDFGWAGETRVVGTYIDPLVASGQVIAGSDFDSQKRFQNDLRIDNIKTVLGAGDYDHNGLQEVYFALTDGSAYLHAYMHADGNIQYANYQSQAQVIAYLQANGWAASTYAGWFA